MKNMYLKGHSLFSGQNEKDIGFASSLAQVKIMAKGDILDITKNDMAKIYVLITGSIKIKILDPDNQEFVDILSAPEVFGEMGLNSISSWNQLAQILTEEVILFVFKMADFRKVLERNPVFFLNYVRMLNSKLQKAEIRCNNLVYRDVRYRLFQFLGNWAKSQGEVKKEKIILKNYLTHQDIASVISSSRQSVSNVLNDFQENGMMQYDRKRIELNPEFFNNVKLM